MIMKKHLALACMALVLFTAGTARAADNTATSSGFWTNAATWTLGVPQSDHDVIIPASITVTNTGLAVNYINSLSITGTLTHAANTSTEANKINLVITNNLTIAAGGSINVQGKGYGFSGSTGYGPGGAQGRSGAAHGGQGSIYDGTVSLITYGSVTNPVNLGSGCASSVSDATGSAGGGAVILQVGGTLTVNATAAITANGNSYSDRSAGAGGSVNIKANSFSGSGTISADGGNCVRTDRGGGGGGRIALIAGSGDATQFGTLAINARGGDGANDGGAGTIFLKAPTQTYGSLVIKNLGAYTTALTTWTNETWRFDSITTTNYGVLVVGTNSVLDFTGTTLVSDSTPASITSRIIVDSTTTSRYVFPASFTMGGCLSQSGTNLFPFPGDVIVATNGVLTHEGGSFATTTEANRLNLNLAGNLTVNLGGVISVKGRGYGAAGGTGYGPGGGPDRSGASHGGQGADGLDYRPANMVTYGSIINPVNYGSGGGGRDGGYWPSMGGGAIVLQVGGTVTVNGLIIADGNEVSDQSAAAGGSVNISAASFAGTNTISAKGGSGLSNAGGAGGGRIALKASGGDSTQFNTLTITAAGGASGRVPAAGTVYLEAGSQGAGKGTVWVNNGGASGSAYTAIPPFTNAVLNELSQAMVAVTNYGKVFAPASTTVGNLLIYTNCSWTLTNRTLTVGVAEHSLEDRTVSGPGRTNRVDRYGQILWMPIRNTAATNITSTTADLAGTLNAPGTNYDVTVYWSPNNNADAAAWLADAAALNAPAGAFTNVTWQPVTGAAASLSQGTTYYYTLVASNVSGAHWASPNASFRTHDTPTVENAGGATLVGPDFATLRGELTAGTAARAYLVWGNTDPGTENTGDWQHMESFGWVSQGAVFSTNLVGLQLATTYYYRCYVTNDVATDWSPLTSFSTANTATNSGNWENAGTWSAGVPGASDYVYIPAGATVTMNGLDARPIQSVLLAGTLTHAANTSTEANKINLVITNNLTIAAGGSINVNGKGYGWNGTTTGYGPGGGVGLGCASHGGQSGGGNLVTYGSVTNPVNLGSGCAGSPGSAGGGAVLLQVGGTLTVAAGGQITADGDSVQDRSSGSGGSVNIAANAFVGSGTISALGASNWGGARPGGGGGRIALVATSGTPAQFGTLTINARGGASGGAAGTIYLKAPPQTYGSLVIKNFGAYTTALTIWTNQSTRFDSITLNNYGVLAVGANSVLDFTGTTLVSDSTTNSITSRIILDSAATNRYVFPASFTNAACLSQSGTNLFPFPGDVIVATNGVLTHEGGFNTTTTEANKLNLNIAGSLTVQAGGAINVKGRGYGCGATGYGPGGSPGRAGASHGGQGANSDSTASTVTYGSVINPVNYGSGGGNSGNGIGGGAVILQVGGAVTVAGLIMADGSEVSDNSIGAGGSVNISATSFAGAGTISVKGGRGLSNASGAGGGRIALKAGSGDSTQFNTLTITAEGGGSVNGGYKDPAAGTVYLEAGSLGSGTGTVWINNGGVPTGTTPSYTYTAIPPFTNAVLNELSQALVAVTNYGKVFAPANTTVGNLVIYTNCSWTLTNFTVTVISREHYLGDLSIRGQGDTNRVDYYNQIIWAPKLRGTIILFR